MNRLLTEVRKQLQPVLSKPETGASAVLSSLSSTRVKQHWANAIFRSAHWLVLVLVTLITLLSHWSSAGPPVEPVSVWLFCYLLYVLALELTSRHFRNHYERRAFQLARIVANYLFVTTLLALHREAANYYWVFYSLTILQTIVYLRGRAVLLVSGIVIATYWLVALFFSQPFGEARDYALLAMNSLILSLLALVCYWLFVAARSNKVELLNRTRALNQASMRINSAQSKTNLLQVALTEGLRAIRTDNGSIMLADPASGELEIKARLQEGRYLTGEGHRRLAKREGIAGWVAYHGIVYNCLDTAQDHWFVPSRTGRQPRSLLCVPIVSDGPVLGVINADHSLPHFFEQEDVEFLSALAANLASALDKVAQHERLQWMATTLLGLHQATAEMQSELDLSALLNLIAQQAAQLLEADSGCILLLDQAQQCLTIRGAYGMSEQAVRGTCDRVGKSIAGRVVERGTPIIATDIPNHPWFDNPAAEGEGWLAIVSTPMWIKGQIIGTLDIHSKSRIDAFTTDNLQVLSLMARSAEVAIEKAQLFAFEHQQLSLVKRTLAAADQSERANRLEALLSALAAEIKQSIQATNFVVVLKNADGCWLYNDRSRTQGAIPHLRWLCQDDESLYVYISSSKTPLLLNAGTEAFCQAHGLSPVETQTTRSWLGVPLVMGEETVGAMIIEDDQRPNAFLQTEYEWFQSITHQLAGMVYAAWLDEQRTELYQQLLMLQSAGETIMLLAEQNEEWLWHATLTLATAHYGLQFERAILFLAEDEGRRVCGRLGIGHFDPASALVDWQKDEQEMTWQRYLQDLQLGKLWPTAIDQFVRDWRLPLEGENDAFALVLRTGEIVQVPAGQAHQRLPHPFVEKFGPEEYSLVPLKAGNRVLGLVALSNPFKRQPHKRESLVYFATFINQAALICENLRQRNRLHQFITIDHKVFVSANSQPLADTLNEICEAAKELTGADMVAIYPFKANTPTYEYDLTQVGFTGSDREGMVTKNRHPSAFTRHVLETGLVTIADVEQDDSLHGGLRAADHDFIQRAGIRSLIGVAIRGPITRQLRGILYINFLTTRTFTEQEIQLAELFARLGNLAIRQSHDYEDLRSDKQVREEELQLLGAILQQALVYGIDEAVLLKTMLEQTQQLFASPDVHFAISLLNWRRGDEHYAQPVQIRRTHYLTPHGKYRDRVITENIYFGISGRAMQQNATQFVPDVTGDPDFYDRGIGTRAEIDVPVTTSTAQILGVLTVESPHGEALNENHVAMLERLAAVLGLALENARRQRNLETLLNAAAMMTAPVKLEETLEAVLEAARQVAPDLSLLTIWHKSPTTGDLVLGKYFGVRDEEALRHETPRSDGLVNSVMRARKPVWAESFEGRALFTQSHFIQREQPQSSVVFPLLAENEAVGVLFFSYHQPHRFGADEHLFFPMLAQIAAASIHRAQLLDRAKQESKRLGMALNITEMVGSELSIDQILTQVLTQLTTDHRFSQVASSILLYNKAEHALLFSPASHPFYTIDNPAYADLQRLKLDDSTVAGSLALASLEQQREIWRNIDDVRTDPCYAPVRLQTRAQLTITLYSKRQGLLGVLVLESARLQAFDRDAERMALGVARQITIALERAHLVAAMRRRDVVASAAFWAVDVAHDINSETGLIRNWIAYLGEEIALSEAGREYVENIKSSVVKLASIMPLAPATCRAPAPTDSTLIEEVLRHCIEEFRMERPEFFTVDFQFQSCPDPVAVKVELPLLGRIFRYLVKNALEAVSDRPFQHLVVRTVVGDDHYFEIHLEDSGPGITDSRLRQSLLNEPVLSGKGEGHGYGLLFASAAAEQSGGAIRLLPHVPDKGATFVISFPTVIGGKPARGRRR